MEPGARGLSSPHGLSLVFCGFMGAGKTTAARSAAHALDVQAVDADEALEQRLGTTIRSFFEHEGEARFRAEEERLTLELLDPANPARPPVLSLGGGAVESARIRAALAAHRVVWIDAPLEDCWRRAHGTDRPLARDREAFTARFVARRPLYEAVADVVLPTAHVVKTAMPVIEALPPGAKLVWAGTAGGAYPVVVGAGARAIRLPLPGRAFTVTDDAVGPLWAPEADVVIPAGEAQKTLGTAQAVWRALAAGDVTRGDHVRAVGGGVVGDLAGFCAATYQRGIPVVQLPTTVVAMVDAAIGGKTGVDLPEGKNYVGAYHQPAAVLADLDTLATLPEAERAAGYAEVVKTALIAGGTLWERVRSGAPVDAGVVFACARTKVAVVSADERDGGLRQVLNLGHTVGHALETVTRYERLRHGEAVGLGLLAALRLSGQPELRDEVAALLAAAGLPTTLDGFDPAEVAAATRRDKKRVGEAVPFVLVRAPGDVRHGQAVGNADLLAAVEELRP